MSDAINHQHRPSFDSPNGGLLKGPITAVRTMPSSRADAFDESWISIARQLVQNLVIGKTPGHQPTT